MAMSASSPRLPSVAGRGKRGLIGRLLAVVLTGLAFTTLMCGAALADQMPAGMAQSHAAPHGSMVSHAVSETGMSDQPLCDECVREDSRGHCDSGLPEGVRDDSARSGPCSAPADEQVAVAIEPVQAATVAAHGNLASRPPDLHQLQVLRV
ncbi:hypothetical protein ACLGIH_33805 [Streptomyces sp. HMX87]|uniref:hypothetical protein n=1 Tax=Streptomyces sp. HMX87 TaxID=3390849 RepID=UPI003A835F95